MYILRTARSTVGVIVGIILMLSVALWTFAFADKDGPRRWARWSRKISHGGITKIGYDIESNVSPIKDDDLLVIYANHQTSIGLSEFIYFLTSMLNRRLLIVAKSDLYPWVKWPCERIGLLIVIDRNNREAAKQAIRDAVPNAIAEKKAIFIFPDSSRWTPKRARNMRSKFFGIPGTTEMSDHVLMPRTGGLFQIIDALADHEFRLIEIGNGFNVRQRGLIDVYKAFGSTFHVFVDEIDPTKLPKNEHGRRIWLNSRYYEIARRLARKRGMPFNATLDAHYDEVPIGRPRRA